MTDQQRRELSGLAELPDSEIDTSDAPELADLSGGVRGRFHPAPRPVTLDIDGNSLSADTKTRRFALVRERALRDERTLLREAREEGRAAAMRQAATNLIRQTHLDDAAIAAATGLHASAVAALRREAD